MSKKANPSLIGAFVLIALGLALAAIIVLGRITFKDNRLRCVAVFTSSLYGLDVGAPVTFRGVTIGRVSGVRINFDKENGEYLIPVYLDIEQQPASVDAPATEWHPEAVRTLLRQQIDKGLRAQLKISSLLTSKLYIELAFFPGSSASLHNLNNDLLEIPSQPSGLEQITQTLERLPLTEILNKTATALDGINRLINSPETHHALASLDATLNRLNGLLTHADAEFPGIAAELKRGLGNISTLSAAATQVLQTTHKELPSLSVETRHLLAGLGATAEALTKTLHNIEQLTAKDSLLSYQVAGTLREIEQTAASIRQLTDYLQQTPNALIFGQAKEKP